jgi:hypothetical protein
MLLEPSARCHTVTDSEAGSGCNLSRRPRTQCKDYSCSSSHLRLCWRKHSSWRVGKSCTGSRSPSSSLSSTYEQHVAVQPYEATGNVVLTGNCSQQLQVVYGVTSLLCQSGCVTCVCVFCDIQPCTRQLPRSRCSIRVELHRPSCHCEPDVQQ